LLRLVCCAGADRVYRERIGVRRPIVPRLNPIDGVEGV
jgi:hypothetical protein